MTAETTTAAFQSMRALVDLICLDYNCFQRRFDDPDQIRIRLEALACEEIFLRTQIEEIRLAWSFMHEEETMRSPFPNRNKRHGSEMMHRDSAFLLLKRTLLGTTMATRP